MFYGNINLDMGWLAKAAQFVPVSNQVNHADISESPAHKGVSAILGNAIEPIFKLVYSFSDYLTAKPFNRGLFSNVNWKIPVQHLRNAVYVLLAFVVVGAITVVPEAATQVAH